MSKTITIYTDGSADNKTRIGGFGISMKAGDHYKEYCEGSYHDTTSARMEIMGVLRAIEMCTPGWKLDIYCDNRYVVDTIDKGWLENWLEQDILDQKANPDLWRQMKRQLVRHEGNVTISHVKGHNGHPQNELCDRLANEGRLKKTIRIDKRI